MSSTSKPTKAAALARVQALIAGTQKHFPNGSLSFGNAAYTTASLVQLLQSLVDAMTLLNADELSVKDSLLALKGLKVHVDPVVREYERFILAAFGNASQQLADFGMQPPKARKPMDAQQRAAAVAKLRATRKARGTTSKKQKLAVKGDVTGVVVTPVTNPASLTGTPPAPLGPPAQPAPAISNVPTAGNVAK
jgi:hypothetical protein